MEFKGTDQGFNTVWLCELIETKWNLKKATPKWFETAKKELIET